MGIFGPSTKEVYAELAQSLNTEVIKGSGFSGPRITLYKEGVPQYIDTYTQSTGQSAVVYSRIQMLYVSTKPFHLKVYKKGFFTPFGKALGMQDIEIGRPEFDDDFVIKGNDESVIRTLLSDFDVLTALSSHPKWVLEIKDRDPLSAKKLIAGEQMISLHTVGIVKEIEVYKALLDLISRIHALMMENNFGKSDLPATVLYKTRS